MIKPQNPFPTIDCELGFIINSQSEVNGWHVYDEVDGYTNIEEYLNWLAGDSYN